MQIARIWDLKGNYMSENSMNEFATAAAQDDISAIEAQNVTLRAKAPAKPAIVKERRIDAVKQVRARDELLTDFGKKTLVDRYLLPEESYQDMFARVSVAYADDYSPRPAPL